MRSGGGSSSVWQHLIGSACQGTIRFTHRNLRWGLCCRFPPLWVVTRDLRQVCSTDLQWGHIVFDMCHVRHLCIYLLIPLVRFCVIAPRSIRGLCNVPFHLTSGITSPFATFTSDPRNLAVPSSQFCFFVPYMVFVDSVSCSVIRSVAVASHIV